MNRREVRMILIACLIFVPWIVAPCPLRAQGAASLSGTITDPLGETVANAKVSVKNLATERSVDTQTDTQGHYSVKNLPAGAYEVSVTADGFVRKDAGVTLVTGSNQTLDLALQAPSSNTAAPSLQDLGFSASQIKGSAAQQALLDKRSHMLQIHQKLGLITAGTMVAALIASSGAKGHHGLPGSPSGRNLHMALGATTAGLYAATAYYAIRAPKIHGLQIRGPIRLHRALAYIHGPGMILTAVLGIMAYQQLSNGERVHGIARAHGAAAMITAIAFGASILSVSFKF